METPQRCAISFMDTMDTPPLIRNRFRSLKIPHSLSSFNRFFGKSLRFLNFCCNDQFRLLPFVVFAQKSFAVFVNVPLNRALSGRSRSFFRRIGRTERGGISEIDCLEPTSGRCLPSRNGKKRAAAGGCSYGRLDEKRCWHADIPARIVFGSAIVKMRRRRISRKIRPD